jgi:hypothetical protein
MPAQQVMTQFPQGIAQGIILRGLPILQTQPGRVFWVYNGTTLVPGAVGGSNNNRGSYYRPFSTVAGALAQCTANAGDIILVKPGHAETISSASILSLNVAGVAIIGLGAGSLRPTFTFTTATTANIPVTAANMSIQNLLFVANFADVASFMTATGTNTPTDFSIEQCEFRDTSSILNALAVFSGNATANSCNGFRFVNNRVSSLGTTAATTALKLASDTDRLTINGNVGCSAVLNDTAALLAAGTAQLTNFELGGNVWERPNTSSTGGSFVSGSGNAWTGHAHDNLFYQVDNSAGIWIATGHGSAFGYSNNYSPITGAVDKSALINPAAV